MRCTLPLLSFSYSRICCLCFGEENAKALSPEKKVPCVLLIRWQCLINRCFPWAHYDHVSKFTVKDWLIDRLTETNVIWQPYNRSSGWAAEQYHFLFLWSFKIRSHAEKCHWPFAKWDDIRRGGWMIYFCTCFAIDTLYPQFKRNWAREKYIPTGVRYL